MPVDHSHCQRHRLYAVAVLMSVIRKETLHSKLKRRPLASHSELDGITDALSNKSALMGVKLFFMRELIHFML